MDENIQIAGLIDQSSIRELNSLLNVIAVKDFYWHKAPYIRAAITEKRCFVIKNDSMIMGAMIMEFRVPDEQYPRPSLAIGTLSVRPGFRRNGLGILLVSHARAMAGQEKKRLYVESFLEFRQLSFYQRLGFKEGSQKEYHGKPYHVLFIDP